MIRSALAALAWVLAILALPVLLVAAGMHFLVGMP